MAWTRDSVSQSPKVIYTPDEHGPVGVTSVVYDPDAPSDKRITAYLAYILQPTDTLADIDNALGF